VNVAARKLPNSDSCIETLPFRPVLDTFKVFFHLVPFF